MSPLERQSLQNLQNLQTICRDIQENAHGPIHVGLDTHDRTVQLMPLDYEDNFSDHREALVTYLKQPQLITDHLFTIPDLTTLQRQQLLPVNLNHQKSDHLEALPPCLQHPA